MHVPTTNGKLHRHPGATRGNVQAFRPGMNRMTTVPAANVTTSEHKYEIHLAAPGLKKEMFEVKVVKDLLTISASDVRAEGKAAEKLRRKEFDFSGFSRNFRLPDNVDINGISASYTDGILVVALPKKPEAGETKIEIQ